MCVLGICHFLLMLEYNKTNGMYVKVQMEGFIFGKIVA